MAPKNWLFLRLRHAIEESVDGVIHSALNKPTKKATLNILTPSHWLCRDMERIRGSS